MVGGNVIEVTNKNDWAAKHAEAKDGKAIIVDFTATWCGPCRVIGPYFVELSNAYPGLIFLSVDVDACEDVSAEAGVSAMPTFQVWKNGEKVEELVGAAKEKLKEMVEKYAGAPVAA